MALIPSGKYDDASALFDAGEYQKAYELFTELGDFSDARERAALDGYIVSPLSEVKMKYHFYSLIILYIRTDNAQVIAILAERRDHIRALFGVDIALRLDVEIILPEQLLHRSAAK